MFRKFIHFIKYNNATLVILALMFIIGASTFAAGPTGQELIGKKNTDVTGVDNSLLLVADLDELDMDFKISKIEQDDDYYYVTYTFINLIKKNNAWLYEMQEKNKKISKSLEKDLGIYLAEKFKQENDAIIDDLKVEQAKAEKNGPEKRQTVTEYSGLIGKILDAGALVFPGYEPVKKIDVPSPQINLPQKAEESPRLSGSMDNLEEVYNDYISTHDLVMIENQISSTTTSSGTASSITETPVSDIENSEPDVEIMP